MSRITAANVLVVSGVSLVITSGSLVSPAVGCAVAGVAFVAIGIALVRLRT